MWVLPLPIDIQRIIHQRLIELHIIQRNQLGWDKINEYFTNPRYNEWMILHLSEHLFDWNMQYHCITRLPRLMSI